MYAREIGLSGGETVFKLANLVRQCINFIIVFAQSSPYIKIFHIWRNYLPNETRSLKGDVPGMGLHHH